MYVGRAAILNRMVREGLSEQGWRQGMTWKAIIIIQVKAHAGGSDQGYSGARSTKRTGPGYSIKETGWGKAKSVLSNALE